MKLAWLCKNYEDDYYIVLFEKPEKYRFKLITPIVFTEIVK